MKVTTTFRAEFDEYELDETARDYATESAFPADHEFEIAVQVSQRVIELSYTGRKEVRLEDVLAAPLEDLPLSDSIDLWQPYYEYSPHDGTVTVTGERIEDT